MTQSHALCAAPPCTTRRRRYRREQPRPMALTARDAAVIQRIHVTGFSPAQATFLYAREADPSGGGDNWSKRLRALYDAGWITRLYLPQSRYLAGSQWPVYCVETGVAAQAASLRVAWPQVSREERARLTAAAAPVRAQLTRLLTAQLGMPEEQVVSALRTTTQHALKLYSGLPCHVPHQLLATTFSAIAWYGLAAFGAAPHHIQPDGALDLNAAAHGSLGNPLLPDLSFIAGRTLFCIEAETGTSSRAKIQAKVRRYLDFAASAGLRSISATANIAVARLRVVFHCATVTHLRMVASIIAAAAPQGSPLFLLSDASTFHLEYPQLHFRRNLPISDEADAPRLYDALASLATRAVMAQVEGVGAGSGQLGYIALSDAV
jgi:hypothetical protein